MLKVTGLRAHYGGITALAGVELEVAQGEIVALLGSNGAGKSTLLGCITASAPCEASGSIVLDGAELLGKDTEAIIRAGVVLVPEGRQLFGELTVHENLLMGAYISRSTALEDVYRLFPVLKDRRNQLAQTLSGGEQQMVALGRALMARPRLMLLDEPSLGLAPKLVGEMFRLIRRINENGVTILLVEQNARQALRISHRAYVLEKGRVSTSGVAASLASDPAVVASYLGT
ncbi:MAG TPA: ABC transporter ATP-binding protein [Burkholderiales bacterium]|nr:ABC transporter ATP-binding protein [Burkholderiales bacterium]